MKPGYYSWAFVLCYWVIYMKRFIKYFEKALLIFPLFLMIHIMVLVYLDSAVSGRTNFLATTLKLFISLVFLSMEIMLMLYLSVNMDKKRKTPRMMASFNALLTILFVVFDKIELVQYIIIVLIIFLDFYLSIVLAKNLHNPIHKLKNTEDKYTESFTLGDRTFTFEHTEKTYPVLIPIAAAIITGSCAIIAAILK